MSSETAIATTQASKRSRFVEWIQEPMGSVIAASVSTISLFGVVLSGMWMISAAMN